MGLRLSWFQEKLLLAYLSKALGPKKLGWSVYAKEMLVVLETVRLWRPYLIGRKFRIITDQQPLKHLLEQRIITPEQQKFIAKLLGYDFEILYQSGHQNLVADALSRCPEKGELGVITGPIYDIWGQIKKASENDLEILEIRR